MNSTTENPMNAAEKEQVIYFLHGSDQPKYSAFKTRMINGWITGGIKLPETINTMYRIAGSWADR